MASSEFSLVVERVDPHFGRIGPRQASHLQSHQGHLVDEGQVACDERRQVGENRHRVTLNYDTELDALSQGHEVENPADRLLERARSLDDEVMQAGFRRVDAGYQP